MVLLLEVRQGVPTHRKELEVLEVMNVESGDHDTDVRACTLAAPVEVEGVVAKRDGEGLDLIVFAGSLGGGYASTGITAGKVVMLCEGDIALGCEVLTG